MYLVNLGESDMKIIIKALETLNDSNEYIIANNDFFEMEMKEVENVRIASTVQHLKGFLND